jgi:hypothetical protein
MHTRAIHLLFTAALMLFATTGGFGQTIPLMPPSQEKHGLLESRRDPGRELDSATIRTALPGFPAGGTARHRGPLRWMSGYIIGRRIAIQGSHDATIETPSANFFSKGLKLE